MKYTEVFLEVENKLLGSLEDFFSESWGDTNLPSHDLDHHRRVWKYSKDILEHSRDFPVDKLFIRNLMISVYLHDTGMSEDHGIRHGMRSRVIAEKYLSSNNLKKSHFTNALDAIENHDNKDYRDSADNNLILKILSVADDLDAFGPKGIQRYIQIYQARGVPEERIGPEILKNAESRFENFKNFADPGSDLFHRHSKRYNELREFFENYNRKSGSLNQNRNKSRSDQHSSSSNR